MENNGALTSETVEVEEFTKPLEGISEDSISLPDGGTRETSTAETEVLNCLGEEEVSPGSPKPRPRPKPGRDNTYNINSDKENMGTGEVTKRISSWFSSFWISQDTNEEVSNKDDPEFARFKKGLFDSLDNVRSTSEPISQTSKDNSIWLMGVHYEVNNYRNSSESNGSFYEASNYYTTPGSFPHLSMQQTLSPTNFPSEFYQDFTSRIWCTYRHNYAPIKPTSFTNDGGWGCMLRSSQSLLANALIVQFLGREWRRTNRGEDTWDRYVEILTWFIDDMSSRCPFSVHRVALLGKQHGKNIGEWFGPSTASQVIKALVEDYSAAQLSVHVVTDGVVYKNEVYRTARNNRSGKGVFQSILILVAIRLGTDNLNPIYYDALKAYFRFPHSVGIAGGKPSSSYYFIGTQGDDLFYLDPHYSRPALELKATQELTEEEMATFHCDTLRKIPISQLDPSMLLGFYCRNSDEFEDFCNLVKEINKDHKPVFTIEQEAPVYGSDLDFFSDDEGEFETSEKEEEEVVEDEVEL